MSPGPRCTRLDRVRADQDFADDHHHPFVSENFRNFRDRTELAGSQGTPPKALPEGGDCF
jgi:hypothetical protein